MRLQKMAVEIGLHTVTFDPADHNTAVTGGYCSNLLSNVMAKAEPGNVWVTIQTHRNVLAVAEFVGLAAVIISGGKQPDNETVSLANQKGIALFTTPLGSFEISAKIYNSILERGLTVPPIATAEEARVMG